MRGSVEDRESADGSPMMKRIVTPTRQLLWLLTAVLSLCGCTPQRTYPAYMHPELLYVKAQPYTRLYVEADMVEGAEVPQKWLDELRAFLSRYCDKPGGITVVRDDPIPLSEMKGLTIGEAALLCTDGPPLRTPRRPLICTSSSTVCVRDYRHRTGIPTCVPIARPPSSIMWTMLLCIEHLHVVPTRSSTENV
jgi:hypothetical protein